MVRVLKNDPTTRKAARTVCTTTWASGPPDSLKTMESNMVAVCVDSILVQIPQEESSHCWCALPASYTVELTNMRVGTGRFERCRLHARRDLETGDFKLVEARI
jgi:hypothetical protein